MSPRQKHTRSAQNEILLSQYYETRSLAPGDEAQVSRWATSLRDFSALMLPYFFGLCIALAHLLLFSLLNQKRVGIDTTIPQSWVSSASFVLVTTFRLCLGLALGDAFTQHLWRITRLNPIKVADLDRYYTIQREPLELLHWRVLFQVPSLYAMAFIGFSIGLATIFPPGALTVEGKLYQNLQNQSVGIFDASFMGNGSLNNALGQSLLRQGRLFMPPYFETKPIVSSTAKMTSIGGALPALTSPCGPNCTYSITFDGPQVKCDSYVYNGTGSILIHNDTVSVPNDNSTGSIHVPIPVDQFSESLPDWGSDWTPVNPESWGDVTVDCPQDEPGASCSVSTYYKNLFFEWYSLDPSNINITSNGTAAIYSRSVRRLECVPGYGKYTADITFSNGVPLIETSSTYVGSLVDLWRSCGRTMSKEGTKITWLDPQGFVKAANLFAALTSFAQPLKGQIGGAYSIFVSARGNLSLDDNSKYDGEMGASVTLDPTDTIVLDTAFNTRRFELHNQSNWKIDVLNITEHNINQALQNITIALMKLNSFWNTTTNVTQSNYQNIFVFSPVTLIVPYACCLAVVLPFLLLGYTSLRSNGVPAISGGFVQTLMTTTGSEALRDAAAAGCLGGKRNVPQQLKDMEIMYGELRDEGKQDGDIRRATFGLKGEIVELKKGALYGR
ncbi:hypothetical protein EJ04DRAFT_567215 [Polyplosphaeria fusca]|uniref:Uncharacterized protein n=1 Tax=Polyplosphaeria fusca TaxID=682080 RepID=A0A9P4QSY0_9PLEO|nr:hypothetical protein EJ04DRAFT_567215 [Polyplosphaeria fusca]